MYVNTVLINKRIKILLAVGMNGCIRITFKGKISGTFITITITNYTQLVFVYQWRTRNDRVQATKRISVDTQNRASVTIYIELIILYCYMHIVYEEL